MVKSAGNLQKPLPVYYHKVSCSEELTLRPSPGRKTLLTLLCSKIQQTPSRLPQHKTTAL